MEARPTLATADQQTFRQAQQAYQQHRYGDVANLLRPLLVRGIIHADLFALHAMACARSDQLGEARQAINAAVNLDRDNARYWVLLADIADLADDHSAHVTARRQVSHLAPDDADHWAALGYALIKAGDDDGARPALERAITLSPGHGQARHNLAMLLRNADAGDEALRVIEPLIASARATADNRALHAHLLCDRNEYDAAVDAYRAILREHPGHVATHQTLAALLPQLGRGDEAMDGYAAALAAQPDSRDLWVSAMAQARAMARVAQLDDWSTRAMRRFADDADIVALRADAIGLGGDAWAAAGLLEEHVAARPDHLASQLGAAYWNLVRHEPAAAEAYAVRATHLAPEDQTAWAYLATIWRLRDDPRSGWLNDVDRLVHATVVEPPAGFADLGAFMGELATYLTAQHQTQDHPADQSLRSGTQTRGHLFLKRDPLMHDLVLAIKAQCENWLAGLASDETHPFLARNSRQVGFVNSWSVRLRDNGFHVSHIHHKGWLSSAFYVAVPPEVLAADPAAADPAGALSFGIPDAAMGYDLPPLRVERPIPGKLCLFPSYLWHGTTPFHSAEPRLTVAFDALPM